MRILACALCLCCAAASAADTITTTSGERYTKAADGKYYPSNYVAADGSVKGACKGGPCGDDCKCAPGVCPQRCPADAPRPMPAPECKDGKCPMPLPKGIVAPAAPCPDGKCPSVYPNANTPRAIYPSPAVGSVSGNDALAEVNAKRAARGLRPFLPDPDLTEAAQKCAAYRARYRMFGHVTMGGGDFAFLPYGARAASAGCAAYPPSYGWMSCCVYDNYTHGGAAWVMGDDGRRYMHLFVR